MKKKNSVKGCRKPTYSTWERGHQDLVATVGRDMRIVGEGSGYFLIQALFIKAVFYHNRVRELSFFFRNARQNKLDLYSLRSVGRFFLLLAGEEGRG